MFAQGWGAARALSADPRWITGRVMGVSLRLQRAAFGWTGVIREAT